MFFCSLRSLEFWISHLHTQKDVVTTHYHSWGFLSMSLGRCQPLFQELLLLLQPLAVLPFDLNLLLEPRLLCNRQLCPEDQVSPPAPSSGLLATSWPLLQADRRGRTSQSNQQIQVHAIPQQEKQERWPEESEPIDEGEDCVGEVDHWSQVSMESRQEEQTEDPALSESQHSGLRWASLFGAASLSTASQNHAEDQSKRFSKRPSQWLHLDRSQLGLLAQSFMSMKLWAMLTHPNCDTENPFYINMKIS